MAKEEGKICFPDLTASKEEKAVAISIIDHYLNPIQINERRTAFPKAGKKDKKVIQLNDE